MIRRGAILFFSLLYDAMLLFNFQEFIAEMREKEDKKDIISRYEELYGPIQWDIYDQIWYREYLEKFSPVSYATPEEMDEDFDWDLLLRLILGSFSSDYQLAMNEERNLNDLIITVKNGDQSITKTIAELWSFQILRIYEIYIEEQLNMEIIRAEDEEWASILAEREVRLRKWKAILDTADRAQLAEETKISQAQELEGLLGQL